MISFESDYEEGAHPEILKRLLATNLEKTPGYGQDAYTESARCKIRQACACPEADVFFLVGGTQTNQTVIDAMLPPYAGVLAVDTGHVSLHEAGAIEFTGHKVLTLPNFEGKMTSEALLLYLQNFYADVNHEHMVFPGLVYISHPTEYGTLYSKEELTKLRNVCSQYDIPLYLDGARLGYALACPESDLSLADVATLTDVFYIGGTKVGAFFGEAVVFTRGNTPAHFMTRIKQHGALLAKGRILGVQFDTLFTDSLYEKISRNAIRQAEKIRLALQHKGYRLHINTPTNQIFVILRNDRLEELRQHVAFSFWEKADANHTIIRLATSWATTDGQVQELISLL